MGITISFDFVNTYLLGWIRFWRKSISQKIGLGYKVKWTKDDVDYSGWVYKVDRKSVHVFETIPPYKRWKIDPETLRKI